MPSQSVFVLFCSSFLLLDARDTLVKCAIGGNKLLRGCAGETVSDVELYALFAQVQCHN